MVNILSIFNHFANNLIKYSENLARKFICHDNSELWNSAILSGLFWTILIKPTDQQQTNPNPNVLIHTGHTNLHAVLSNINLHWKWPTYWPKNQLLMNQKPPKGGQYCPKTHEKWTQCDNKSYWPASEEIDMLARVIRFTLAASGWSVVLRLWKSSK